MTNLLDLIRPPVDIPTDMRRLPLEQLFPLWLERNPHIVERVIVLALADVRRGVHRCSMKRYFELIRGSVAVDNGGPTAFRLDNSYTGLLSRHVMDRCPELQGRFELRTRRAA